MPTKACGPCGACGLPNNIFQQGTKRPSYLSAARHIPNTLQPVEEKQQNKTMELQTTFVNVASNHKITFKFLQRDKQRQKVVSKIEQKEKPLIVLYVQQIMTLHTCTADELM